ncbi:ABC transporter permease [Jatrophihabitans telluris]|uniref:ABC transporter permease n=1 Tax=Jatrophihabitans telluris TaxID=2038343 RepID=A0ABY4QWL2_9ACTN|nr:ABC transporter permease [Jatrophihabitans telluris]UQX87719.1 ABC transporter permease [Jatrophihabitans telluris]
MTLPQGEVEVELTDPLGAPSAAAGSEQSIEGRSLGQLAWRRLRSDRGAIIGAIIAAIFIVMAIFAPLITSVYGQDPSTQHQDLVSADTQLPFGSLGNASASHLLGVTPVNGFDIFAQIIYGARTSLIVGFGATAVSVIIGVTMGLLAGYYRGLVDVVISWFMDVLLSFPTLLFALALLAIFGQAKSFLGLSGTPLRFVLIIFVLGFFAWPYIGRIVRGQVLSLREREFVDAARSLGASDFRILAREILPNMVGPILVYATLSIPNNILGEAGLSYLGVGFQYPTVSWGQMMSDAGNWFQVDPLYLFSPGLAIFLSVLAFNIFGDGLRDALDPKSTR